MNLLQQNISKLNLAVYKKYIYYDQVGFICVKVWFNVLK